jgi:TP901 family phage tail tape measure protein
MASKDLVFRFLGVDGGAGREFDKMAGKSATLEKALGKTALGVAGLGVALGVESVRAAAKFQQSMELIHTQAGRSQKTVDAMSKSVLAMAGSVATAPDELSKGLYHLASTGLSTAKSLSALRIAAEGAKMGGADLESVTNALNATIASGIKGSGDFTKAMGALNAVVGSGDMRMQDLAEAMGTGVLAAVKGFGLSLNDVGAALATFGDNNIRGADAATQLRMAVLFMAKPAASAKDALKSLGLSSHSLANDMGKGGLGLALTDLHNRLIKAGDTGSKMGQVLLDMFGHKAGTGIAILEQQFGRFQSKQEEVHKGSKNFASDWTSYTKTFGYSWDRAQAAFQSMTITLGTKLLPTATKAMNWIGTTGVADLSKFSGWVSDNKRPIEDIAKALAAIAAFRLATGTLSKIPGLLGARAGGGGLLGTVASKAEPVPVYVTNQGFGGPGGVGIPGGKGGGGVEPIPGGGSGIPGLGTGVKSFVKSLPLYAVGAQRDLGTGTTHVGGSYFSSNAPANIKELLSQVGQLTAHNKDASASFRALGKSLDVKTVQAWVNDWKQGNPVLARVADSIDREKQSLADFRSMTPRTRAAVNATLTQLQRIPGAMALLASEAQAAGRNIGSQLDAGLTVGIQAGAGKVNIVTKAVVDGVVHTATKAAVLGSPSKKTIYIGRMLAEGLGIGMGHGATVAVAKAQSLMQAVMSKLGAARGNASGLAGGVAGNLIGGASLANLPLASGTTAFGSSFTAAPTIAGITSYLSGYLSRERAFSRNLGVARKKGLSAAEAANIAQLGLDSGGPIAAALAGGSRSQVHQVAALQAGITSASNSLGNTLAQGVYGAEIRKQTHLLAEIKDLLAHAPKDTGNAVGHALKSPHAAKTLDTSRTRAQRSK